MSRCSKDTQTSLGVKNLGQPPKAKMDLASFRAVLTLLDLAVDEVDGYLLTKLKLPVADLIAKEFLDKKNHGDYIMEPVENSDGHCGFRRLKVNSRNNRTWAQDELSGGIYDLCEGDLCRYSVDKSYLRERLKELISAKLIDLPMTSDEQDPYVLGSYCICDQRLPVVLVSQLWDSKHADRMGRALLRLNQGLTIALTTTSDISGQILGPGLVVSLSDLVREVDGEVSIELSRANGEIRRYLSPANVTNATRIVNLIENDVGRGVLIGPWPIPWILVEKKQIAVVRVFVEGSRSGQRQWSLLQIQEKARVTFRTMGEFFRSAPEWKIYIRKAAGKGRLRRWELNISTPDPL